MHTTFKQQLESKAAEIKHLSDACGVLRLEVFGSATRDRFDPARSDLDFLVTFREGATSIDNYLRLAEGLEELFGRSVDLVIDRSISNPYFRKAVDATRTLIYAHGEQEAPV
jgi:predicted nucleotidyltransferase